MRSRLERNGGLVDYKNYKNNENQHEEDLQRICGFRLIDDDFMNACFDGNIEGTELLLRIILNKPDISVESVTTQKVMKNLLGRDIWLDIDAIDSTGKGWKTVFRADCTVFKIGS